MTSYEYLHCGKQCIFTLYCECPTGPEAMPNRRGYSAQFARSRCSILRGIFSQEKDSYTSCLAKTNAVLHNKAYITIKAGNTFSNPQYNKEYDSELRHFDYIVANPPFGAASAGGKRRPGLLGKNCSRELLHEVVTKAINEAFREKEAILPLLRGNIVISLEEVTSNQIAAIDEQMRSMQQELLATIN